MSDQAHNARGSEGQGAYPQVVDPDNRDRNPRTGALLRCRLCGSMPPLGGADPAYQPRPKDHSYGYPEWWSQCADIDACKAAWVAYEKAWQEHVRNRTTVRP